jgi:hypothetical protein
MTESGSVAVSVEALRTANVPTLHPYAASESSWVLAQLGKDPCSPRPRMVTKE